MKHTIKESRKNSVKNLEYLYSTVVGLGLSLAIYNLINAAREQLPIKLDLLPFFFTLLITLIPFYHGAVRHLDITYVEHGGKHMRKGALLADFTALFLESCLLLALGVLLEKPLFFVWGLVLLFAFDAIWGFVAHLGFTQKVKPKPELRWAIINLITAIFLSVYLVCFRFMPSATYESDPKIWGVVLCVAFLRSVIDYWWCWDTYYPSSSLDKISKEKGGYEMNKTTNSVNDKNSAFINFMNPWSWVIIVLAFAFVVYLSWKDGIVIAFAVMSMFVSSYLASRSLGITTRALQLARATTRPFLCCSPEDITAGQTKDYINISFKIYNSGSLPANNVEVDTDFFGSNEEITEGNTSNIYLKTKKLPTTAMILPNSYFTSVYIFNLKDINDVKQWNDITQSKTKMRIRIFYQSHGRKYLTIQTEQISQPEWDARLVFFPIAPQKCK